MWPLPCPSFEQTEVTTVICDTKQLAKIRAVADQLPFVQRVVVMKDLDINASDDPPCTEAGQKLPTHLHEVSFSHVESQGRLRPLPPNLPQAADLAVIMYTSGSTGMPKVMR